MVEFKMKRDDVYKVLSRMSRTQYTKQRELFWFCFQILGAKAGEVRKREVFLAEFKSLNT